MRKLAPTLLALPVLAIVYMVLGIRSAGRLRALGFVGVAGLAALILMSGSRPAPSAAVPPSTPQQVAAQLLDSVVTGHGLKTPFSIGFDAPMEPASVAGALRMSPEAGVTFSWDAAGKTLTIAPVAAWAPDTLYTITVDSSARAADGGALAPPVHAVILTAPAGTATVAATKAAAGGRVTLDTAFAIHLDRTIDAAAVQTALQIQPAVTGSVAAGANPGDYVFTPDAPLAPGTDYQVSLVGLVDADGIPFEALPSITVHTVAAPSVVRFRPVNGSTGVAATAVLSVRFSDKMNRASTTAAFAVTAAGKPVAGRVAWAESDHVLVFTPKVALSAGASVVMTVASTATSASGAPIAGASSGTFTVKPKPVAKPPAPKPTTTTKTTSTKTTPIPRPTGSGGSGGLSGSWYSVEVYYLSLMNCTRTGGWVTSSGACSSPGGRNVAPLALSSGISSKVSRPYAKLLATRNLCNHWYDGSPADRLARAGYTSYNWAENVGCENLSPYNAVLGDHLFFQSEVSYNGGHYRNMMNALYTECGIGVWVYSGRVRLVIDFYRP